MNRRKLLKILVISCIVLNTIVGVWSLIDGNVRDGIFKFVLVVIWGVIFYFESSNRKGDKNEKE